jgi:hypothetical protein
VAVGLGVPIAFYLYQRGPENQPSSLTSGARTSGAQTSGAQRGANQEYTKHAEGNQGTSGGSTSGGSSDHDEVRSPSMFAYTRRS